MSATLQPKAPIYSNFDLGESGWDSEMNGSLYAIAHIGFHLTVLDRDLTAPPGSPTNGDTYIIGASATGAWAGHDGEIAVWTTDPSTDAWLFYTPRVGYIAYLVDEQKLTAYKAGGWSTGIAI